MLSNPGMPSPSEMARLQKVPERAASPAGRQGMSTLTVGGRRVGMWQESRDCLRPSHRQRVLARMDQSSSETDFSNGEVYPYRPWWDRAIVFISFSTPSSLR